MGVARQPMKASQLSGLTWHALGPLSIPTFELGLDCRDDNGAIAKARFIATQIAIDTPQLNHRHVAVLNDAGDEIFEAPIRSKPPVS